MKHHIIISGTGRAGTTFLVQLLTALGLDTGFESYRAPIFENCNAGMEWDLRHPDAPYIVKSPWICDYLEEIGPEIVIDHAIIPMRDLFAAAQSRRAISEKAGNLAPNEVPGGLWHTATPEGQEEVLTHQLYKLLFAMTKRDIPMTLLYFPKFISDPEYLYKKLGFLLKGINYEVFLGGFQLVSRPELVHDFARSP
jgi:hypothetical protein